MQGGRVARVARGYTRSHGCCWQILSLQMWALLMEHRCLSAPPHEGHNQRKWTSSLSRICRIISIVIVLYASHFPPHTPTLFPRLPPTQSPRTLSAEFLLRRAIAASQYPIMASVFLSLSPPPPLSRLYRKLIPKHLVFWTSARQWPLCVVFFNPGGRAIN